MDTRPGLTEDERAELERLRAEVASLRLQARKPEAAAKAPVPGRAARQRWRTVVATLLIVLGCVLAPLTGVAVWARNQITNTDRYLATVAPLASDPAIQNAIADQIAAQIFTYIDVQGLTVQAVDALAERRDLPPELVTRLQALSVPIANGVQSFTRTQVGKVAQSPAFADAWLQANRLAHEELVKALTGQGGGAIMVENDTVSINLAAFIQTVKAQLIAAGFTLAERIPQVNASFVVFQSKDITRARSAFNLLTTLGNWLPVIALLLLGLGVYVARDHRRADRRGARGGRRHAGAGPWTGGVPIDLPGRGAGDGAAARRRGGAVRHHRALPAGGAAHRLRARAGRGRRRVPDRPVDHRHPHPPRPCRRHRLAPSRRRGRRPAHRPRRDLGPRQPAAPADRRGRAGQPGPGVLGPADRQGRSRPGPGAGGGPGGHRVPGRPGQEVVEGSATPQT
jgi:hypothetical protein